eukprot:5059799-Pleurochrysis_carterae.AAC.2
MNVHKRVCRARANALAARLDVGEGDVDAVRRYVHGGGAARHGAELVQPRTHRATRRQRQQRRANASVHIDGKNQPRLKAVLCVEASLPHKGGPVFFSRALVAACCAKLAREPRKQR